ncbi:MAG: tRNA 2-thiouridine(34) synthase MnmA [Schleiferiaceae bacterium]|nr:tRNA 2-thiouridine(34) synthase MnmA [Schleiferiaceae bacterium]
MARVVVGLSGGVDSSVAAWLLQQEGHEVIGLFMRNWVDETVTLHDECPWVEDSNDAMLVADHLGIPFQVVDLSEAYRKRIVDYMFAEYQVGRTPNPDVLCNREIKFDIFLDTALKLGADFVATGHYCQKSSLTQNGNTTYQLLAGADANKDQSYFLCQLNQQQLAKALFPIGHLQKPEVREIAKREGLATAEKKDSQGLCFIGKVRLPDFLQQQLTPKKGAIVEISADHAMYAGDVFNKHKDEPAAAVNPYTYSPANGNIVGEHIGAHYFTRGQRKGLKVGGKALPLFVIDTDVQSNTIYVGQGEDHPGLYSQALFVAADDVHWIREDLKLQAGQSATYQARFRYRQPLMDCTLHQFTNGLYVVFESPQKAISPGQFVAWYHGNECIGSGVIER